MIQVLMKAFLWYVPSPSLTAKSRFRLKGKLFTQFSLTYLLLLELANLQSTSVIICTISSNFQNFTHFLRKKCHTRPSSHFKQPKQLWLSPCQVHNSIIEQMQNKINIKELHSLGRHACRMGQQMYRLPLSQFSSFHSLPSCCRSCFRSPNK